MILLLVGIGIVGIISSGGGVIPSQRCVDPPSGIFLCGLFTTANTRGKAFHPLFTRACWLLLYSLVVVGSWSEGWLL